MALEFRAAKDLQPIIDRIIELFYPLVQGATVRAVYRSTKFPDSPLQSPGSRRSPALRHGFIRLADGEQEGWFLIQIVVPNWERFEARGHVAIIDHEICHIHYNDETDTLG
jgi:hypothetical protein